MGRDNHPRHRAAAQLERKGALRAPYARVLIVTEGEKTEPNYLRELRAHYKLNSTNIKITKCRDGTAPVQIVECAESIFLRDKKYDQIFCVFDRDSHASFNAAIEMAEQKNNALVNDAHELVRFKAIASNPCFELWLLIHFEPCAKLLTPKKLLKTLDERGYIPNYSKGKRDIFKAVHPHLKFALRNARTLMLDRARHGTNVPFTDMSELVENLISIKSR